MSTDRHSPIPKGPHTPEPRPTGDVATRTATQDASAPLAGDDLKPGGAAEPDALKLLGQQLHELTDYILYYVAAKTDGAKLSLKNAVIWISFAALGFVVVAGLAIIATWLLFDGIAQGVSVVCGGRWWVGSIVTGVLLLVGLGLAMHYAVAAYRASSRERVVREYEQRQARQQAQFGRNVLDSAATTASPKN